MLIAKAQISAFDEQLALAAELGLPVVIHTREADEDTRSILANHSGSLATQRGHSQLHEFTGAC